MDKPTLTAHRLPIAIGLVVLAVLGAYWYVDWGPRGFYREIFKNRVISNQTFTPPPPKS
jgi:hypothetical protein